MPLEQQREGGRRKRRSRQTKNILMKTRIKLLRFKQIQGLDVLEQSVLIHPLSLSLSATKALSLHLLPPIDLESPSLCGDFEFVPSLLLVSLPPTLLFLSSTSPPHPTPPVPPPHHTCILTKCASSFCFFFLSSSPAKSFADNVRRKWRLYRPPHYLFRVTRNGDALMASCLRAAKQMASNK